MRRALASFLLLVFSFLLIAPAVLADVQSNLPECCRRGGKHHCAMQTDSAAPAQDTAFGATQPRCASYPGALATPVGGHAAILNRSGAIFDTLVSHPAIHVQTEAGYRISLGRAAQKRGPPVLS